MKKIFLLLTVAIFSLSSCGDRDEIIFDGSQGLVGYESSTASFGVINATDEFEVTINVTNIVNFDRSVAVTLNEELSNAPANSYTILNAGNLIIPANSETVSFIVKGDPSLLLLTKTQLIFDLTIGEDSGLVLSPSRARLTMDIFRTCPVEDTKFIGQYAVQQVVGNPQTGAPTFVQNVVTLKATGATTRSFDATFLQAGGEGTIEFSLICTNTTVDKGILTGLQCAEVDVPNITLAAGLQPGTVNVNNDSTFTLTFTEFEVTGGCEDFTPQQVVVRFTKL